MYRNIHLQVFRGHVKISLGRCPFISLHWRRETSATHSSHSCRISAGPLRIPQASLSYEDQWSPSSAHRQAETEPCPRGPGGSERCPRCAPRTRPSRRAGAEVGVTVSGLQGNESRRIGRAGHRSLHHGTRRLPRGERAAAQAAARERATRSLPAGARRRAGDKLLLRKGKLQEDVMLMTLTCSTNT